MTELVKWLEQHQGLATVAVILLVVLILALVVILLAAFFQGREIAFWPPKIGEKPQREKSILPITPVEPSVVNPRNKVALPEESLSGAVDNFTAIEVSRNLAPLMASFFVLEFVKHLNTPFIAERVRNGKDLTDDNEGFLSDVRKRLHSQMLGVIHPAFSDRILERTTFELRDVLSAAFYSPAAMKELRDPIRTVTREWVEIGGSGQILHLTKQVENALKRVFEQAVLDPRLTLLSSWQANDYCAKYKL